MTAPTKFFNIKTYDLQKNINGFKWLNIKNPELIRLFVKSVEFVDNSMHRDDKLLCRIAQQPINQERQKELAQFFTPPDVAFYTSIQLLNNFQADHIIFDPAVGKGSLLITAASVLAVEYGLRGKTLLSKLKGSEICSETHRIAIENIYYSIQGWLGNIKKDDALQLLGKNIENVDFFNVDIPEKSLIIANPPYKEIRAGGNMWIPFVEKIINSSNVVAFGLIVPVSISSATRTASLRESIKQKFGEITAFHHDTRPRPLFRNVEQRITILNATKTKKSNKYFTTGFLTHKAKERLSVWELEYEELSYNECKDVFPKVSSENKHFFVENLSQKKTLIDLIDSEKENFVWVRTTGRYKLQAQLHEPEELTSKWKKVHLNQIGAKILIEIFENGKALEWWKIYGDGRDLSINRFLRGYGVDRWTKSKFYTNKHMKLKEMQDGEWQKMEKNL